MSKHFKNHTAVKTSGLNYLRFFLVVVWAACSVVSLGTAHSAELLSALSSTLPSDRQCQTLWNQRSAEKHTIEAEIEGWCLVITRSKGNCLACHDMDITPWPEGLAAPGNIAPVLANIANRFPNRIVLKNIIYNAASENPQTFMPLFGKHEILTESEIDRIVDFLMTR